MGNFFKNFIFQQFPEAIKSTDTYVDNNGEGLLQRFTQIVGMEIDENFKPFLDNFLDIVDTIKADDKYLQLIGSILGYPPSFDGVNSTYRRMLAYAVAIYKIKGSSKSYEILLSLIGIVSPFITEEVPIKQYGYDQLITYDTGKIYDSQPQYCSGYYINFTAVADLDNPTKAKIDRIRNFLEPINANFLGYIRH